MDDVMMFNRAPSAKEIKALFESQKAADDGVAAKPDDTAAKPDPVERLKKLKSLFDQGLISKEEYDKKARGDRGMHCEQTF